MQLKLTKRSCPDRSEWRRERWWDPGEAAPVREVAKANLKGNTLSGRTEATALPFTGEREKGTPLCFTWVGESEDLLVVMGDGGGEMYAVCRANLFHMTGLGLFLSTALLSSEESGSVTT